MPERAAVGRAAPELGRSELESAQLEAIASRYSSEARTKTTLSCGNALPLANLKPGEVLVDLGCGRGRDVIGAAHKLGSQGAAIGLDSTPAMLEAATAAALAAGLAVGGKTIEPGKVHFIQSSMERIALPDASADIVISNCAINHAPAKDRVFREIHRILKMGGRFVVSDIVALEDMPAQVAADPVARAACYGGAITREALLGIIQSAGFSEPETLEESEPYWKEGYALQSVTLRSWKTMTADPGPGSGPQDFEET